MASSESSTTGTEVTSVPHYAREDMVLQTPSKKTDQMDCQIDSGYSSQATSQTTSLEQVQPQPRVGPILSPLLASRRSRKKKMPYFDLPVNQLATDRFISIQPHFEKLLLDQVLKSQKQGTKYKPMSSRLVMMGPSRSEASPEIVVFCHPEQEYTIKRFVKQEAIVAICSPNEAGTFDFKVTVIGSAPRLRAHFAQSGMEVFAENTMTTRPSLCGTRISFRGSSGPLTTCADNSYATCGGLIKVTFQDGCFHCLGITVSHPFASQDDPLDAAVPEDPNGEDADRADSLVSVLELDAEEDDTDIELNEFGASPLSTNPHLPATLADPSELNNWHLLGKIVGPLTEPAETMTVSRNYDWALFEPSRVSENHVSPNFREITLSTKLPGTTGDRSILMVSGGEVRTGRLLWAPGRILIGAGREFVDTYMITIPAQGICDGDSGAWVIDAHRYELYGQLVASDAFGSGYVIPMHLIFDDIKQHFNAERVELPTTVDILTAAEDTLIVERHIANDWDNDEFYRLDSGYGSNFPSQSSSHPPLARR